MQIEETPDKTSNKQYDNNNIEVFRRMLTEQQVDLKRLCTVVEDLENFKTGEIDIQEVKKYEHQIEKVAQNQIERFSEIDDLITENVYALKKNKTTDHTILTYGKELRKLEAGLRTLRLFANDILQMLCPKSTLLNRVNERVYYFTKRSASLQVEMKELQHRISFL